MLLHVSDDEIQCFLMNAYFYTFVKKKKSLSPYTKCNWLESYSLYCTVYINPAEESFLVRLTRINTYHDFCGFSRPTAPAAVVPV